MEYWNNGLLGGYSPGMVAGSDPEQIMEDMEILYIEHAEYPRLLSILPSFHSSNISSSRELRK